MDGAWRGDGIAVSAPRPHPSVTLYVVIRHVLQVRTVYVLPTGALNAVDSNKILLLDTGQLVCCAEWKSRGSLRLSML